MHYSSLFLSGFLWAGMSYAACDETAGRQFFSHEKKIQVLENKLSQAKLDLNCHISILLTLSELYRANNTLGSARERVELAVKLARQPQATAHLLSEALTQAGNTRLYTGNYAKALVLYSEALTQTQEATDTVKILINIAQLWTDAFLKELSPSKQQSLCASCTKQDIYHHALTALQQALKTSQSSVNQQPENLLHLAQIAYQLNQTQSAIELLKKIIAAKENTIYSSHAYALLGQIYFDSKHYQEAVQLLNQAVFYAQQAQAVELLFHWQHRLGKVYKVQNEPSKAITAYQNAIDFLKKIRPQLLTVNDYTETKKSLHEKEDVQVYLEFIALLLDEAKAKSDTVLQQDYLHKALTILEGFKTIELQTYYRDDCIAGIATNNTDSEACNGE